MFNIELIYALPKEQKIFAITVNPGVTIEQAIIKSNILNEYPEINLEVNLVGVFSQRKPLSYELKNGDRIEIYRELIADPKEVRRNRAQSQRRDGIIK